MVEEKDLLVAQIARKGKLRNKEARKTNEKRKELQLFRMNKITQ